MLPIFCAFIVIINVSSFFFFFFKILSPLYVHLDNKTHSGFSDMFNVKVFSKEFKLFSIAPLCGLISVV